ncbi:hypothetical protein K493DRAFT_310955, partial [Basidiobolus meristosporus CBS 931.73]
KTFFPIEAGNAPSNPTSFFATAPIEATFNELSNPWGPHSNGLILDNLLVGVSLAPMYSDVFNMVKTKEGYVTIDALHRVLGASGLTAGMIEKILAITLPYGESNIDRKAFDVILVLVALAQKNMEVSLESIVSHKQDLPIPLLPRLSNPAGATDSNVEPTDKITSISRPSPASHSSEALHLLDDKDLISVQISLQKGGVIFKHVNYILESKQHLSSVTRRYKDFWWLLEILTKRYPSRMLPTLPPKKIGGDKTFLERRRKGLSRFINFIARHPVLKNDNITVAFLTEPTSMEAYRKLNTVDVEEEFSKIEVTDQIKAAVPHDLEEKLRKLRERLDASVEYYTNQCLLMERIAKRQEGSSEDMEHYSRILVALGESPCHDSGCLECPQIISGLNTVADSFIRVSAIMKEAVDSSVSGVVDHLRRQKEIVLAFKELLDRKEKLISSGTETLASRIKANQGKIDQLRGSNGPTKEIQRLTEVVSQDRKELHDAKERDIFIQYCLWRELQFYHQNTTFVTKLYQQYVTDQIRFTTVLNQAWKDLSPTVWSLPEYNTNTIYP